jgi:hypothetical protein
MASVTCGRCQAVALLTIVGEVPKVTWNVSAIDRCQEWREKAKAGEPVGPLGECSAMQLVVDQTVRELRR